MFRIASADGMTSDEIEDTINQLAEQFGISEDSVRINDDNLWANYVDPSFVPIIVIIVLYLIAVFAMMRGGFTDPGILPRQKENYYWNPKRSTIKRVVNGHFVNYTFHVKLHRYTHLSECYLKLFYIYFLTYV